MSEQTEVKQCCVTGHLHEGTPKGTWEQVAGIKTYVSKPEGGSKTKTAIFIPEIYGIYKNAQLLADEWAANGFFVYVPDVLEGDAIPESMINVVSPNMRTAEELTLLDKAAGTAQVAMNLGPWLLRHREAVTKPLVEKVFQAIRADPEVGKIAAVGFCWGARYCILSGRADFPTQPDVIVAYHPSFVAVPGDFDGLVTPTAILVGTMDSIMDQPTGSKCEEILHEKLGKEKGQVKFYPRGVHGFAIRGDDLIQREKDMKEEGLRDGVAFANKFM